MPRTAAATAGLLPILCFLGTASAQEDAPAAHLPPGFELRSTFAVTGGFDSNPEELPENEADGSAFVQTDLALRATLGDETRTQLRIDLEGSAVKFLESEFATQHEAEAELEVRHVVSDELLLSAGLFHERDNTDDPPTLFSEAWGRAEAELGRLDLDVRGAVAEYHERIEAEEIVEFDLENFDYRVATAELRATLDTATAIAPLVRGRVGAFDYHEQRPGKPDRDALEHSVLAGAVVTFSDALVAELGLRRTQRDFEEPGAGSYSRLGPDIYVVWDPTDRLRLTAAYGHYFSEPDFEDVLVIDTTFAELDVEYEANERLTIAGGASLLDEEAIGTGFETRTWRAYANARWLLREHLLLIAAARFEQEEPEEPEVYGFRRVVVRAGLEASF